jgi:predicted metal-binding membrane protein
MSTSASRPERPALVAPAVALLALAAGAWALTAERMAGMMDSGPGADLGSAGWFAVTWLLMMAAMMLPALVPAASEWARVGQRPVAAFVAGYLGAWTAAGMGAYAAFEAVRPGRYAAAGVILVAAAYQFSAGKERCLGRCRHPLAGASALAGGLRHGAWCVACCAGLMAALFALGIMSLTWMAVIAALIAAERLLPWRSLAVYAVGAALAVLGAVVLVAGPI